MSNFIDNQKWRYATKKFDSSKKVSTLDLEILKEAIQLSSSSFGLQPYKVFIIEDPNIRTQMQPMAWNQSQITDASHVLVFANNTKFGAVEIDEYIQNLVQTRGIPPESVQGYADFMKMKITALDPEIKSTWTSKQTYLALANLLNAAAELKIDVTPMEGFEPEKVNELLGFNNLGLNASLIATIGYRHEEDATQFYKKVRKSKEELFTTI
jgi:nitroreductase